MDEKNDEREEVLAAAEKRAAAEKDTTRTGRESDARGYVARG